jgi:hypothetical protein
MHVWSRDKHDDISGGIHLKVRNLNIEIVAYLRILALTLLPPTMGNGIYFRRV